MQTADRLGTVIHLTDGGTVKCIAYRSCEDIDAQFSNGVVAHNMTWRDFTKRKKMPIAKKKVLPPNTGELIQTQNGVKIWLVEYRKWNDVDIRFENGTIVQHVRWDHVLAGTVRNPNIRVGTTVKANNGQLMTCIKYHDSNDITIRFDDGTIISHKKWASFESGNIRNPNRITLIGPSRLGEINVANNGQKIKIVVYRKAMDLDVQFEDGTIVQHKNYRAFKSGSISNPNFLSIDTVIGLENKANNGQPMKIVAARSCQDIDIQFNDGTIVKNKRLDSFRAGKIANPNVLGNYEQWLQRKNIIVVATNGERIRIVNYHHGKGLDVQFEDGAVVKEKTWTDFKNGNVMHPSLHLLTNSHFLGFKTSFAFKVNGLVYYRTVDAKNNSCILTPQMMMKKAGVQPVF